MPDGERPNDRCATPAATGLWGKYRVLIRRLGPAGILTLLAGAIPAVCFVLIAGLAVHLAPWLREHMAAGEDRACPHLRLICAFYCITLFKEDNLL